MILATTEAITFAARGPWEEARGPFSGSHPTKFQPRVYNLSLGLSWGLDQWSLQCQSKGLEWGYNATWLMREVSKLMCSNSMSRHSSHQSPLCSWRPLKCVSLMSLLFTPPHPSFSGSSQSLYLKASVLLLSCFSSEWCGLAMISVMLHIAWILVILVQANPTIVWACRSQLCEVPDLGWQPGWPAQICMAPETKPWASRLLS